MDIEELEDYLLTEIFQRSPLQVVPTLQDKGHWYPFDEKFNKKSHINNLLTKLFFLRNPTIKLGIQLFWCVPASKELFSQLEPAIFDANWNLKATSTFGGNICRIGAFQNFLEISISRFWNEVLSCHIECSLHVTIIIIIIYKTSKAETKCNQPTQSIRPST